MFSTLFLVALAHGPALPVSPPVSTAGEVSPDAVLLRYPDISSDQVVFRFAADLWVVPKTGGEARRVTSTPAPESFPKFSPDGKRVAFVGNYDGGNDLYVMDLAAGIPERLTYHPGTEVLCDWTPDGESLLYWSSEISGQRRAPRLMLVPVAGGQPEALPVPYGGFGAIDATGEWLAYNISSREFRTWKRYQGGRAQDVWLFNLKTHDARRLTTHPGTDSVPMWHGRKVVFLSDRGEYSRLNLFSFDIDTNETARLTDFHNTDVKFPSVGPDDVVFEAGGKLYRYVFATGDRVPIEVSIPGERPALRAQSLVVKDDMVSASAGPSGARLIVEARGELFDVPVEEGVTRSLTGTDGVAERAPAWSPDGRFVAYFSDRSGEYELTLRRVDGEALEGADENGEHKLTSIGEGWKFAPTWSPDSQTIAFTTNDGGLWLVGLGGEDVRRIHTNPDGFPLQANWSPDSKWLTWHHTHSRSRLNAIYLFDVEASDLHEVTSGMFDDREPVFDRDGDWLYFASSRTFAPIYEDFGTTWIYTNSGRLLAVPLRADVENPFAPEDAEEEFSDPDADDDADDDDGDTDAGEESADDVEADDSDDEDEEAAAPLEIAGFESRAILLPVDAGQLGNLRAGEGELFFVQRPRTGSKGGKAQLFVLELGEDEPEKVLDGPIRRYELTADGEKILISRGGDLSVIDAKADAEFEAVDLDGLVSRVRPRVEWRQLLNDIHRLYRDFFYEDALHAVDWNGLHRRYVAALEDATSREDVHWFIGEMIAELNVGHAYNRAPRGGLHDTTPARPIGLLGCDWTVENGAYRIARILGDAGAYDADARSPLGAHGLDVAAGDYLLEVNGRAVDPQASVYAALEGTAGRMTELTVNAEPTLDGNERRILVEPISSETALRYRDWVSRKRAYVHEKSGGRIGYVHVPDTGRNGQNELVRQFLGEMNADALLVDERWNGGGQIPTRFIELLNRPVTNYWAIRHGEDWEWPPLGHRGPKAMLINEAAGSGGDAFPYYFRQSGLGALIGRRTWGGLVGISGNPSLIDGSSPSVPRFAFYELDGTWGIEGHGVDPDIEVLDDPSLMVDGGDPQLDAGIAHLLGELEQGAATRPERPAAPDRSGSGITPEDH